MESNFDDLEPGFWRQRSKLEKILIVLTVVFVLTSIGLLIGFIVIAIEGDPDSICESPECLIAAAELQSSLNPLADPCDDFYEYACGGWVKKNVIRPERSYWSQFDVTAKIMLDSVRVLLEGSAANRHPTIINQTIGLYEQCMNTTKRNIDGLTDLKTLIKSIKWPMIEQAQIPVDYDWLKVYSQLNREHGFNFILSNYVYLDAKNTTIYSIYIDAPSFGVGGNQLVHHEDPDNAKILNAYKKFIRKTVELMADSVTDISDTIDTDIENMVEFEQKLANITLDSVSRKNMTSLYGNKTNLMEFSDNYSGIDLLAIETEVFKDIPEVSIDSMAPLIVYDRDYFRQLGYVLAETLAIDKTILANYLAWRTVQNYGSYTTKQFRNTEFELKKVVSGAEEPEPVWEDCVNTVKYRLQFSVGRLYIDEKFPEIGKQDMNAMINLLSDVFVNLLDENKWMDMETKNKALNKLEKMLRAIAYPDFIKNDTQLKDYYKDLNLTTDTSYMKSMQTYNMWITRKSLKKLFTLNTNRSQLEWELGPPFVDASFQYEINRITFPAGILQSPFYRLGAPISVNLGSIGVVIGHEMTHGFDFMGSQHDNEGNLVDWWDEETKAKFTEQIECFAKQYSQYKDSMAERTIDGNYTSDENIADNGGLRQAFRALENYNGPKQRLPAAMKSYTTEQLFFLSFANVWCTNLRKETLIHQIETDPHSPNKYRVWGTVSNSDAFAKAFNCKRNTTMNPIDKCILW